VETQPNLFESIPTDRLEAAPRELLIKYIRLQEEFAASLQRTIERQKERDVWVDEVLIHVRQELYGKSSEKLAPLEATTGTDLEESSSGEGKKAKLKKKRILLPSERYPSAPLIEREVELAEVPNCTCCGERLQDSGLIETVEYLERIPASYQVLREKKHKYNCASCHGEIKTTPALPRIKPGSAFGDSVIIDAAVSKYCDLIPMGRQVKMAERLGFPGLPPQSLIETSHYLAEFLLKIYERLRSETLSFKILYADETPHRMLEGSEKDGWYFWGFSGLKSAYFEAHDTRSGDVSIEFLKGSTAEYLMSDVYSGYVRTTTVVNEERDKKGIARLTKIYCNAHARRKFKEAGVFKAESDFFLLRYQRIYRLEELSKGKSDAEILENRLKMGVIFAEMRHEALERLPGYSEKSAIVKAYRYFLKNFAGFTHFTKTADAPIDNNQQERLLRNPVIGRKTWYGTHSVRGAETAAVLFSIIESCKLNGVNPRIYIPTVVQAIHEKKPALTPAEFAENLPKT
jgi:transposase